MHQSLMCRITSKLNSFAVKHDFERLRKFSEWLWYKYLELRYPVVYRKR